MIGRQGSIRLVAPDCREGERQTAAGVELEGTRGVDCAEIDPAHALGAIGCDGLFEADEG